MRYILLAFAFAAVTLSASAQTYVTDGPYGGGSGANLTNVIVDSGYMEFTQICFAGATTEPVEVDGSGDFSAAGEYGDRPVFGGGYVNPVNVHYNGNEDTVNGTLTIDVVQDSNSAVLASVVVVYNELNSLPRCGM